MLETISDHEKKEAICCSGNPNCPGLKSCGVLLGLASDTADAILAVCPTSRDTHIVNARTQQSIAVVGSGLKEIRTFL